MGQRDEGQRDGERPRTGSAIEQLRRRLEAIGELAGSDTKQVADQLERLERELLDHEQRHGLTPDPFKRAAALRRWCRVCERFELREASDEADRLIDRLLDHTAAHWESAPDETTDPDAAFNRWMRTLRLQLQGAEHAERNGRHADRFDGIQQAARDALGRASEAAPPSEQDRRAWARQLADQADAVLADVDELAPAPAAAQLAVMRDAVRWHLDHLAPEHGRARRRLKRKLRRLRAEHQERELQGALERRFGRRIVATSERTVLLLIVLVVGLLAVEWSFDWSRATIVTFHAIDAAACVLFLTEFFVKLALVRGRWLWFRRHVLIDLIPSIPVGILTVGFAGPTGGDAVRFGRIARFLRLPRLIRYVRLLRPLLRLLRGFGLMARGLDRLAERYAPLLNRNIILYPTRAELAQTASGNADGSTDAARLRIELRQRWERALRWATEDQRQEIARARLRAMKEAVASTRPAPEPSATASGARRETPARPLLERLAATDSSDIEAALDGESVEQLARIVRLFGRPPLRWLPIIHSFAPRISEDMSEPELIAAAARRAARTFKRWHDRWFWGADLYGTVTPSQFVDRVGTMLVNSSFRPAYRLALFGGGLLLVQVGLTLTALPLLQPVEDFLRRFLGPTILVLGSVSVIVLAVGWWMKRLAKEATQFYERSAEAQYLALTEVIRVRHLDQDARVLAERVLSDQPEEEADRPAERIEPGERIARRLRQALGGATPGGGASSDGAESTERLVMLMRHWLDGAMFTSSDTRVTGQLLGNPAIHQLLRRAGRIDRKQRKALKKLDLRRQQALLGGPYLWFNFISRACTHTVAMLIVEYNCNAIPLRAQDRYAEEQLARHRRWLRREQGHARQATVAGQTQRGEPVYVTTAFTALHFLDAEPERDEQIRRRFGQGVLDRMRADRQTMIRRIFGTYPLHERPKEQRVVNPYTFYRSWLAGGRALLLPAFVAGAGFRGLRGLARWVGRSVREIRRPELRAERLDAATADFRTAVRKINRVRLPVVTRSVELRMAIDPWYLGLSEGEDGPDVAPVDEDARFLDLDVETRRRIDRHKRRARADLQRFGALLDAGLLHRAAEQVGLPADAFDGAEHRRIAAVAYLADYQGVRSRLSGRAVLTEICQRAACEPMPPAGALPRPLLKRRFNRYWAQHGGPGRREKKAAWRCVAQNAEGAADALIVWEQSGEQAEPEGRRTLGELLQHGERLWEQLTALRAVQTLAVLDVLHYRQQVHQLGGYDEEPAVCEPPLRWEPAERAEPPA